MNTTRVLYEIQPQRQKVKEPGCRRPRRSLFGSKPPFSKTSANNDWTVSLPDPLGWKTGQEGLGQSVLITP